MADKPTLNDFVGGARLDVTKLNANNTTVEDAIENGLGRSGTSESNNSMTGNLDMDLNKIQNLASPSADNDAARLIDISDSDATGSASALLRIDTGNALSIETYTELRALITPPAFDIVILQGRSSVSDGGEGIFRWDISDLSTEVTADTQSGIYIAPTSDDTGASGAWVRQYSSALNVHWFGAIGDGTTDDTTALAAVASMGLPVYFPSAEYLLTGQITFTSSVLCEGKIIYGGTGTPRITFDRQETPINVVASSLSGLTRGSTQITGLNNYEGATVKLVSTEELIKRWGHDPFYKWDTSRVVSDTGQISPPLDCTISDTGTLTVTIYPQEPHIEVRGLYIDVQNTGVDNSLIMVRRSDVTFTDLTLIVEETERDTAFIGVDVRYAANVIFDNPLIVGFLHSSLGYGILFEITADTVVKNGVCYENRHSIAGRHTKNMYVAGGAYTGNGLVSPIDSHWGNKFTVDNVQIDANGAAAVSFAGSNIEIKNCSIENCLLIIDLRSDTPELMGSVVIAGNRFVTRTSAWSSFIGMSSVALDYSTYFGRTLHQPDIIAIRDNKTYDKTGIGNDLYLTRFSARTWARTPIDILDVENNTILEGDGISQIGNLYSTSSQFQTTPDIISTTNPKIRIYNQVLDDVNLWISSDNAGAAGFAYEVQIENAGPIFFRIDVDAADKVSAIRSKLLGVRASTIVSTVKTPSFEYEFNACEFIDSIILFRSSNRVQIINCLFSDDWNYSSDAPAPDIHTSRDDAVTYSSGNVAVAGLDITKIPTMSGKIASGSFVTIGPSLPNQKTGSDFSTSELGAYGIGIRVDTNEIQVNINGTIRKISTS